MHGLPWTLEGVQFRTDEEVRSGRVVASSWDRERRVVL